MSAAKLSLGPDRERHHRDITGGAIRAGVFGISDGLVTNVSLILAIAGAGGSRHAIWLAGLAGLFAGAFSMATGEYVSMRAQTELLERELSLERAEILLHPKAEERELAAIYQHRGLAAEFADSLAAEVHKNAELALETHAREELGIHPGSLGSASQAATSSFGAFALGALLPLLPWVVTQGPGAIAASIGVAGIVSAVVGALIGWSTGRSVARAIGRQLGLSLIAATVTFAIGHLFGTIAS